MRLGVNLLGPSGRRAAWSLMAAAIVCGVFSAVAMAQDPDAPPSSTPPAATVDAPPPTTGAPAPTPAAASAQQESMLEFFFGALGPRYIISFGILSFSFVALVILNFLALRRQSVIPDDLVANFEAMLNEKNYQGAYELAKADESFLGALLAAGMSKLQQGYDAAEAAMNEVGEDEAMKMEHRLSYVALIGSLAPMLGLLGTVDGMVIAFMEIAHSSTTPSPADLAKGISTALITTLVGLVMAMPAITFFAYFKNRMARLIFEVGAVSEGLMGRFQSVKK